MVNLEIEQKYLVQHLPDSSVWHTTSVIEQGYLCTGPVVRIRRIDEQYVLTYKAKTSGSDEKQVRINREEELPLTREAYEHLRKKCDGCLIEKERHCISYGKYTIELDVFHGKYEGLVLAEVEFPSVEEARKFNKPEWFGDNVSDDYHYSNAYMATNFLSDL